jgi:hypothetical protein
MRKKQSLNIIGGGAAGFFAAIQCAEQNPELDISILEQGNQVLGKVKISGGGRCNVTHACFEPRQLVQFYPRGTKELLGPFHKFQPADMIDWLEFRGVEVKTESDGRVFPVTDNSMTIVNCLMESAREAGVHIKTGVKVVSFNRNEKENLWQIKTLEGTKLSADFLLIAGGSSNVLWQQIENLGHTIIDPVPSLFTFNIRSVIIKDLMGLSVPESIVKIQGQKLQSTGPLLITHWGLSGPAILKLSAWGARLLAAMQYKFSIQVNWTGKDAESVFKQLEEAKYTQAKKLVVNTPLFRIPGRLWKSFCQQAEIQSSTQWSDINLREMKSLLQLLCNTSLQVQGKSTFKDEFVTCGGIALEEVNFKTMESKKQPGLYFAGEILDIDAITGGFNFQAAWTTAWLAGNAIAEKSVLE